MQPNMVLRDENAVLDTRLPRARAVSYFALDLTEWEVDISKGNAISPKRDKNR